MTGIEIAATLLGIALILLLIEYLGGTNAE